VIQFIPFVDWLAALTSVTLLIVLWDEIGGVQRAVLGGCVAAVAGVQLFKDSFTTAKVAVALQTVLCCLPGHPLVNWPLKQHSHRSNTEAAQKTHRFDGRRSNRLA
jgi:hypothetical protein